jgi:hypothetical protein
VFAGVWREERHVRLAERPAHEGAG